MLDKYIYIYIYILGFEAVVTYIYIIKFYCAVKFYNVKALKTNSNFVEKHPILDL